MKDALVRLIVPVLVPLIVSPAVGVAQVVPEPARVQVSEPKTIVIGVAAVALVIRNIEEEPVKDTLNEFELKVPHTKSKAEDEVEFVVNESRRTTDPPGEVMFIGPVKVLPEVLKFCVVLPAKVNVDVPE